MATQNAGAHFGALCRGRLHAAQALRRPVLKVVVAFLVHHHYPRFFISQRPTHELPGLFKGIESFLPFFPAQGSAVQDLHFVIRKRSAGP